MEFLIVLLVALLAAAIISGYAEWQYKKKAEARNKFLADELERLQERWQIINSKNDLHQRVAHEWMERFKGLEELAAETGEKNKKQIAELQRSLADSEKRESSWREGYQTAMPKIAELEKDYDECFKALYEDRAKLSTTWHAHQIVKLSNRSTVCLTAIVTAEDGPGAVAAFEAQMKEVKAKMRIRSKAPVFAKPVFPNY